MIAKADQDVLLENVAVSQNESQETDGIGCAQETRDHDRSQ